MEPLITVVIIFIVAIFIHFIYRLYKKHIDDEKRYKEEYYARKVEPLINKWLSNEGLFELKSYIFSIYVKIENDKKIIYIDVWCEHYMEELEIFKNKLTKYIKYNTKEEFIVKVVFERGNVYEQMH